MRPILSIAAALLALSSLAGTASAQTGYAAAQPYQLDMPSPPRLGIYAVSTGNSLELTNVLWGTPASRLGLEVGDRIVQINGRPIRSVYDLERCLQHAANYHNGQVRVLIDNVRARAGLPGAQRFVSRATYLDGFYGLSSSEPEAGMVYAAAPLP